MVLSRNKDTKLRIEVSINFCTFYIFVVIGFKDYVPSSTHSYSICVIHVPFYLEDMIFFCTKAPSPL